MCWYFYNIHACMYVSRGRKNNILCSYIIYKYWTRIKWCGVYGVSDLSCVNFVEGNNVKAGLLYLKSNTLTRYTELSIDFSTIT